MGVFRSASISDAIELLGNLLSNLHLNQELTVSLMLGIVFGAFILIDLLLYNKRYDSWVDKQHISIRWVSYFLLIFSVVSFSGVEEIPFIYFQF